MNRRLTTAALIVFVALAGLGATASAAWRIAAPAMIDVATSIEAVAGVGVTVSWSGAPAR